MITIIDIAKTCHEANRALCSAFGDNSQTPWEEAPAWQRDSACDGVRFHMSNPDAPASASHDNWMALKHSGGWKYGPIKDASRLEHPCMVPFEQLPLEQQAKDHLFKAVCVALAPLTEKERT